jgi:hypothetical protein
MQRFRKEKSNALQFFALPLLLCVFAVDFEIQTMRKLSS